MAVPILKQYDYLIASVQTALTDTDLEDLKDRLAAQVGVHRARGVIIDVTSLDLLDSFGVRTLRTIAQMVQLRGAITVIVGIHPDVAFAMAQFGLKLSGIDTALDLEDGLTLLDKRFKGRKR